MDTNDAYCDHSHSTINNVVLFSVPVNVVFFNKRLAHAALHKIQIRLRNRISSLTIQAGSLTVMRDTARTIGIAFLAAAVGAGVALLFAPQSGEKTRRLIRFKAESYAKDLRDEVNANAAALYKSGAESTRRALKRLGKTIKPIAA